MIEDWTNDVKNYLSWFASDSFNIEGHLFGEIYVTYVTLSLTTDELESAMFGYWYCEVKR